MLIDKNGEFVDSQEIRNSTFNSWASCFSCQISLFSRKQTTEQRAAKCGCEQKFEKKCTSFR
jgi:hypothetical protein